MLRVLQRLGVGRKTPMGTLPLGTSVAPLSITAVRLNTKDSNSKAAEQEDREELERERRLREQFAQKVSQGTGSCQSGSCGSFDGGNGMPNPEVMRRMSNFMFYTAAFFTLLLLVPLTSKNSTMRMTQGIAWWKVPVATSACLLLLRSLCSRSDVNRIKGEFEMASKSNHRLTFDQFIAERYPSLFQGYRTSQMELIAAVSACLATAQNVTFAQSMARAAGLARDPKKAADDIMDALRRDFSQLFA